MGRLLLLFIVVPIVELALLIEIGRRIGTLETLGIIFLTGVVGAALARRQGMSIVKKMQAELGAGRLPAGEMVDGVLVLIAGAVLITPGVLTDVFGFLCLIPGTRKLIKKAFVRWMKNAVRTGRARVNVHVDIRGPVPPGGPFYDAAPDDEPRPPLPGSRDE